MVHGVRELRYSRQAIKALRGIKEETSRLIRLKLMQYADDPNSLANNVKMLKGSNGILRLRVGDWRILFTKDGEIIEVVKVAHRSSAYE